MSGKKAAREYYEQALRTKTLSPIGSLMKEIVLLDDKAEICLKVASEKP